MNLNVATYIKFDDITNAQLDIRPSRAPTSGASEEPTRTEPPRSPLQLDGSFNPLMTLSGALDRLRSSAGQETPALGKFRSSLALIELNPTTANGSGSSPTAFGAQNQPEPTLPAELGKLELGSNRARRGLARALSHARLSCLLLEPNRA